MEFVLNGKKEKFTGDENTSLLSFLRDDKKIMSPKDGCSGQGSCGACTVALNGSGALACSTPMKKVSGGKIETTEGMDEAWKNAFARAFVEKGGVQCGFCTPGFVMRAKILYAQNPDPSREEVIKAINKNLCRCTGYIKIIDSILFAFKLIREGAKEAASPSLTGKIGSRHPKYDSYKTVLGMRSFVCDLQEEGMLFGALKMSDHPRARVKKIDTKNALALNGVIAVYTAKDIPGQRHIGLIVPDWPLMVAENEETRYVGDVLCGVVATSAQVARLAVTLISTEYEVLEPTVDIKNAMKAGAPLIHKNGNILSVCAITRGDADKALAESDFTASGTFTTQTIEHAFIEPEACLAKPWLKDGEKGICVYSQGQGAYEDRRQIAQILGLPEKRVKVIQVANGGGFGGKEDLTVQGHAALMSWLTQKPVKVSLTRDESILMHPKRHPFIMDYTVGCDKKGNLTALKADILADTGAYASVGMKVVERGVGHASGAYHVPHVALTGKAVYTNNIPNGAMRGFGVNQVTFAMESLIDELCEKGGFDRWQFRYDNAIADGKLTATGQKIQGGAGLKQTLLAVKDDFYAAKYAGIACGIKNTGIGNGMPDIGRAKIVIESASKVILHHGWTEMGQGVHTMALMTLCEETGINPEIIEVRVDTENDVVCGMTTASRATSLVGNAVINAAIQLKNDLTNSTLDELVGKSYHGQWRCDFTVKPGQPDTSDLPTHFSYSYATQVVTLNDKGRIDKVYAAHDVGRIMNPTLFEGQVEGAVHMGLGYAIREKLELERGRPKSTLLAQCQMLKASHMPEVNVRGVEVKDPHGPYGAKGVGEIGLVPTAGAVAGALYQYDHVKRYALPLNEMRLIR